MNANFSNTERLDLENFLIRTFSKQLPADEKIETRIGNGKASLSFKGKDLIVFETANLGETWRIAQAHKAAQSAVEKFIQETNKEA